MPLPQALIDRAASDLAALDAQLTAGGKQAAVLAAENRYLQMVGGMAALPQDEATEAVDDTAKPNDRATSPADNNIHRQSTSTVCTSVEEYASAAGPGWGYRQEVIVSGKRWVRTEWVINPAGQTGIPWTEET